jgi:hypothetical protein
MIVTYIVIIVFFDSKGEKKELHRMTESKYRSYEYVRDTWFFILQEEQSRRACENSLMI